MTKDKKNRRQILLYTSGLIVEQNPTGGELRFLELAKYLQEMGAAELCCADDIENLEALGLRASIKMSKASEIPAFLPEEARLMFANRKTLRSIARKKYSDVIVFDVPTAVGLILSGVRNTVLMIRKDLIGYEQVKTSGNGLKKRIRIAYQWVCEDACLKHAKTVICQCAYDRDTLLRRHPFGAKKLKSKFIVQINNVNPSWIVQRAEEAIPDEKNSERFRVCFIGGFDDLRKGQDLFLRAAESLTKEYRDLEFVLIGGGKKLELYRKQYESDQIFFLGRKDNPVSTLKSADLLVVPSLADSCPNTVMEAMYTHVPVVGSRAGGIPEILMNQEALFSPEWEALRDIVEHCYLDREFCKKLKEQQTQRAKELSFNWAERIVDLIVG